MITTYHVDLKPINQIFNEKGVMPGGKIQKLLTNEIISISSPYVPFDGGPLKNLITISPDFTWYQHEVPYARYLWYGMLMVDPLYKKGAMFSPNYGFWSRPGVQKELTNTEIKYKGAPLKGKQWTLRAFADNSDKVIKNLQKELDNG